MRDRVKKMSVLSGAMMSERIVKRLSIMRPIESSIDKLQL